jgi:hypothetical protein
VEEVSASAEEMSAQVEEVTASAQSLAEMSADLKTLVNQFKLSADENLATKINEFKQAHLRWIDRLENMLAGKTSLYESQVDSHKDCMLGQWYYGIRRAEFEQFAEFAAIESPHIRLHEAVSKTVKTYNRGEHKAAEVMLNDARRLSTEIVEALDRLERRVGTDAWQAGATDQFSRQEKVLPARGNGHFQEKVF